MKKILILAANPRGDLKLDREIRDLQKAIDRAVSESEFEVKLQVAVRPEDLQELFLKHKPRIVHFCGHGAGTQGLVLVDDDAGERPVSTDAIADLFRMFADQVNCAVFNACDSDVQAEAIAQHIEYAIGMQREILDDAAYYFAIGFYRGLGYGESIDFSYELGCNAIAMELLKSDDYRKFEPLDPIAPVLPEHLKPVLRKRAASDRPSVSLPAEFAEAIAEESDRKQYQDQARETWDGIGRSTAPSQPLTQYEYRQRRVFVGKVKEFWIEGYLRPSLIGEAIELGLQARPVAIQRPFAEIPAELDQSFEQLRETNLFEQIGQGKTLLILGKPGAGKTIALLKLAERLVEQTDLSQPMPVVLNLASWASRRQPIADWLVEELREKYGVPKKQSQPWIEQEQLILLLDGLDEVKADYRNDCVRSLNQFIETHNVTDLVICSRVQDYEALSERLKLSSAICLQPLTAEQVDCFLATSDSLVGLRSLLQHDLKLQEFAQTPLILNVMSLAYRDWSSESLMQQFSSAENQYGHLFDTYFDRMLGRRSLPYPREKILRWLRWLAQQMVREGAIVFLIEELQPSWLGSSSEKRLYQIRNFLFFGLIIWLMTGSILGSGSMLFFESILGLNSRSFFGLSGGLFFGLSIGLFFGLSGGLFYGPFHGLSIEMIKIQIPLTEQLNWSWQKAELGLIFGLTFGLIFGLITKLVIGLTYGLNIGIVFVGVPSGVLFGLSFGLFFGLSDGLFKVKKQITLIDKLSWSWRKSKSGLVFGSTLGLVFGLVAGLLTAIFFGLRGDLIFGLVAGLIFGLTSGLITGLFLGLYFGLIFGLSGTEIEQRTIPNQGIRSSARNCLVFGLVGAIIWLILSSFFDLVFGLSNSLFFGLVFGLYYGGETCIQHFNLRLILYHADRIPWNYARFLDFASDRLLLKKVGGGYLFYHRMLMEHLARQ